ncbi:MAG: hypothetical protein CMO10_16705 [Thalassospira sp.]|nr:hypothetical protein [Thalassospira sp.]|tara:strand:- start:4515 stop:4775 length:261 start_codon:yes stop_codon:yes gene_type:complete
MMIHPFAWQMFKFVPNLSGLAGKQNSFFVGLQLPAMLAGPGFELHFRIVEKNRIAIRGKPRNNRLFAARSRTRCFVFCGFDAATAG